jgi:YHS domain-containing protein
MLAAVALLCTRPLPADPAKARCPISGDEVAITANTPGDQVNDRQLYFCCNDCVKAFRASPEKFLLLADKGKCPVSGNPARAELPLRLVVNNHLYYFCCPACPAEFDRKPASFFTTLVDPVSGKSFTVKPESPHEVYRGQHYFFAAPQTKAEFDKGPDPHVIVYGEKQPD